MRLFAAVSPPSPSEAVGESTVRVKVVAPGTLPSDPLKEVRDEVTSAAVAAVEPTPEIKSWPAAIAASLDMRQH